MDIAQLEDFIENNQIDEVENLILKQPKLLHQLTSFQMSPLRLACFYHKNEIANLIAKHIPSMDIFEASSFGNFEQVTLLVYKNPDIIHQFSDDGLSPLNIATYFGHEEIVRFLILKSADVNAPSQNGFQVYPLHSAVANNHLDIVQYLIDAGAKINIVQKMGLTPLHSAAQNGNIEMIILLLEHGADITIKMEGGKLAADLAEEKGFKEIAEILRD